MNTEDVLETYRKADDAKRLSLFLAYRDLREQFSQIEEETSHDDFAVFLMPWRRKDWHRKHLVSRAA